MTELITTIDLLRHGACEGGEIYRGATDVPLSREGVEQMRGAVAASSGWQQVVSSPLSRCQDFARDYAAELGLPLSVEAGFREMDFGDWEGRLVSDVWRDDRERAERFYADPARSAPPGGEHVADVLSRVSLAWSDLVAAYAGQHVLLVSHGGVMRILLSHLLDMPLASITRLHVPYACMARLQVYHREATQLPVLVSLNGKARS